MENCTLNVLVGIKSFLSTQKKTWGHGDTYPMPFVGR